MTILYSQIKTQISPHPPTPPKKKGQIRIILSSKISNIPRPLKPRALKIQRLFEIYKHCNAEIDDITWIQKSVFVFLFFSQMPIKCNHPQLKKKIEIKIVATQRERERTWGSDATVVMGWWQRRKQGRRCWGSESELRTSTTENGRP